MTLVRFNNGNLMPQSIEQLFDNLLGKELSFDRCNPDNCGLPATNWHDNEKEVEIEISVPGYEKEQITASIENNLLIVKGEAEKEEKKQKNGYYEFRKQNFEKRFKINEGMDAEKVNVSLKNGILHISIPRKEEMLPKRKELAIG